ncbi:phenylacetate-CoA oxygenase subunit PaaC [candidate division KSB1 bacterium]|nr:phenylacetate-CoA oxygenase subunit PaaC [candidate division KSB1 bacterium]
MISNRDSKTGQALFEYLLRLGDDRLVLGHRLSEWCGHAPILEEDIALANIALDCIGQASNFLSLAGKVENKGRNEDDLAYLREAVDFRNVQMVEVPNGDFAHTIARQFLFDVYSYPLLDELQKSADGEIAGIAEKAVKEDRYHLRHSSEWVRRLGDGTGESHDRVQNAFEDLWTYSEELFFTDEVDDILVAAGIAPDLALIKKAWEEMVAKVMKDATLDIPGNDRYMAQGSRNGRHSEHLGHLLAEMQIVHRSYPGVKW